MRRAGGAVGAALTLLVALPSEAARPATPSEQARWSRLVAEAEAARVKGDWRRLERASRSRADLESEIYGPHSPEVAASWSWVAQALTRRGRDAEAEPLYRRAREAAAATLAPDHPQLLLASANHAAVLERLGRLEDAEPLRRTLLDTARSRFGPRSAEAAAAAAALAGVRQAAGRPRDAEPLYRLAIELDTALFGERDSRTISDTLALGAVLDDLGRYADAEPLLRRALTLSREDLGETSPLTARAYASVAANLDRQGRFKPAEPLHRRAVEIAVRARTPELAAHQLGLAANLLKQARPRDAEPLARQALAAVQDDHGKASPEAARAALVLGDVRAARSRGNQAVRLQLRALANLRKALGDNHPETGRAHAAIGANLQAQGKAKRAEPFLRRALAIRTASLGDQHPKTAESFDSLAQNQALLGAASPAEALASRAVAIVQGRQPDLQRGAPAPQDRPNVFVDGPEAEVLRRYLGLAWTAARQSTEQLPRIQDTAFTAAQELAATPAAHAVANATTRAALRPGDAETARVRQDLARQAGVLQNRLLHALPVSDVGEPARIGAALDAVSSELEFLGGRIDSRRAPDTLAPLSVETLQRRLAPGEGLLLIAPAGADLHVFAVSRDRTAWHRLDGGRKRLESQVRRLRCQVDDNACAKGLARNQPFDLQAAHAIYADLIAPVEPALAGARRLFVSADGPLAGLPLGIAVTALPSTAPDDIDAAAWLADRYAITVLPSVASFRATPRPPPAEGRIWTFAGFGAPRLGGDASAVRHADPAQLYAAYGPLPGAARELRAMARVVGAPPASVQIGEAATEAAVKSSRRLTRARVVAFATHGILSNEVAGIDEPGLVLSPPATASDIDDGVLTATEAARLRLQADWVILSACNTAGPGGAPGARNLSGLAQAFLHAGAKALLVSHWRVYDDATSALTTNTLAFQRAQPGLTRAEALQRAMRTVRTGRLPDGGELPGWRPEWSHPAYWGPFVIIAADD
jgi:CHAT domain-containing protein/tetratricopeptide (TPR) repeat protein